MSEKAKYTDADYKKAVEVIGYFKERYELAANKVARKKGIKYIKCQHLRDGTQTFEMGPQWIGETTRLIVCPICQSVRLGDPVKFLGFGDYERSMENVERRPIPENFYQRVVYQIKKMKLIYDTVKLLRSL